MKLSAKWFIPICAAALLSLTACGTAADPAEPSAVSSSTVPETGGDSEPALESVTMTTKTTPAIEIIFSVPDGWTYELVQTDDEPVSTMSALLRPADADPEDGSIVIEYCSGFGVCGTGLEEKEIDFNGHKASQGFYDGSEQWSFILLEDELQGCVILNNAGSWQDACPGDVNALLGSIKFHVLDDAQ